MIKRLFASMYLKYQQRWSSQFTDEALQQAAQVEWGNQLAGLTVDQIRMALERSVRKYPDWPPLVGQFLKLCEPDPAELGLPSVQDAWAQVCTEGGVYSHGVVFAASSDARCDRFNWRLLPAERGVILFRPIYAEYVQRVLDGETFELPVMIEDRRDRPVTWSERKQHAEGHLQQMRAALQS